MTRCRKDIVFTGEISQVFEPTHWGHEHTRAPSRSAQALVVSFFLALTILPVGYLGMTRPAGLAQMAALFLA